MILTALTWARILSGPDNVRRVIKVIGIRPQVHLKVSEHEMLSFLVRKEIIKNDNSLVVILLSKVVENKFIQAL